MKTYQLEEGSFEEHRKKILKRLILLTIIAVGAGLMIFIITQGFVIGVLAVWIPVVAVASYFGIRRGIRIQQEAWESYLLKWDGKAIVKSQVRTRDVTLSLLEITAIEEIEKGTLIKTAKKLKFIFIPKELEDYAILIAELKSAV
ncbi:MAG: hypothetical protein AAGA77_18800 [Bacteroidota bacterium]